MSKQSILIICLLALILTMGPVTGALAQCGGASGYMHNQHMGSSGHLGSGQMGMYGNQAPVQTDPNVVNPGYVAPPASGYNDPQSPGGYAPGQMMNQSGMGSGHQGHMGN